MDVATDAGTAGEPTPIAITPPADTPERLSASDAARLLRSMRKRTTDETAPERDAPVEQQEFDRASGRRRRASRPPR